MHAVIVAVVCAVSDRQQQKNSMTLAFASSVVLLATAASSAAAAFDQRRDVRPTTAAPRCRHPQQQGQQQLEQQNLLLRGFLQSSALPSIEIGGGDGVPISDEDFIDHVSGVYMYGPNGALGDHSKKRRTKPQQQQQQQHPPAIAQHEEEESRGKQLDRHPALVLNADYQPLSYLPLSLWNWQEAVKAVFCGKVHVVDVYENVAVRACHWEIALPSVIALTDYVPQYNHRPAFTKRNVFLRDEYRCQYCRKRFATKDLTLDHVVPRCSGGRLNWKNAVTCCKHCNGRKGCLPVTNLPGDMKLANDPIIPSQYQLAATASRMLPRYVHPTWAPYLTSRAANGRD